MGKAGYLLAAGLSFLGATTGADLIARTSIGGEAFASAAREHLHYAVVQLPGTLFLLAPFVVVALICAVPGRRARSRSVIPVFAGAMLTLLYFYYHGHQGSQHALLEDKWTAAALSIGLLPFFIGIPVVLAVLCLVALATKLDRAPSYLRSQTAARSVGSVRPLASADE